MISIRQNAAINLAKAYHLLASATGDMWHIDNAQKHLEVACVNDAERFDFDAAQYGIQSATAMLIAQADDFEQTARGSQAGCL